VAVLTSVPPTDPFWGPRKAEDGRIWAPEWLKAQRRPDATASAPGCFFGFFNRGIPPAIA
jgi:hypothetical protein